MKKKLRAALVSLGSKSSQWTVDAMKKYFSVVDDINLKEIEVYFSGKKAEITYKGKPLQKYDCFYLKGSFRYANILRAIAQLMGTECYTPIHPNAFTVVHDKLLTQLYLAQEGIPTPKTWLNPTPESARKLLEGINYPIIMKFPQGTQGKGVMFAESYAAASSILDVLSSLNQPFIIQEYIETGSSDLRLLVVGDKVVAGMKRTANIKEKRANLHAGGKGYVYEPDDLTEKVAVDTAKALGAEVCGVDILESGSRGPMVIEANISPGLQGITNITKIDVASKIARYLYNKTEVFKSLRLSKSSKNIMQELNGEGDSCNEIICQLDLRGTRILLPDIVTKVSKFNHREEYVIRFQKDELRIKPFN